MTTYERLIKESKGKIVFKYYGVNDLATGFDVKFIVENYTLLVDIFSSNPLPHGISNIDDCKLYFLAQKYCSMEEVLPYINTEEDRGKVEELLSVCKGAIEPFDNGMIIRYINKAYNVIFDKNERDDYGFHEVVFDYILRYSTGIDKGVWFYLAENYDYLLINNHADLIMIFNKDFGGELLNKLISFRNGENLVGYPLRPILDLLSEIISRQKNNALILVAKQKIEELYSTINNLNIENSERGLILKSNIYEEFLAFLIRIKDGRANSFKRATRQINRALNEKLKSSDKGVGFGVPISKLLEEWRAQKTWVHKLLYLTHDLSKDGGKVRAVSRLEKCDGQEPLLDHFYTDIPTDEYFTYSRQLTLQMKSIIGGGIMLGIIKDDRDTREYSKLITSALYYIRKHAVSDMAKTLEDDQNILVAGLLDMASEDNKRKDADVRLYGLTMLTCALAEKLLKILVEDLIGDNRYISTEQLTLGGLLDPDSLTELATIFKPYHMRHLQYFLSTCGKSGVGQRLRNDLAHLSRNIEQELSPQLLSKLLWLFNDILNTVFWYYAKKEKVPSS